MSKYFDRLALPNATPQNLRQPKRRNPVASLCIKAAFYGAATLASAGIAAAYPAGGIDDWNSGVTTLESGTTFTAADALATNAGGSLIQLAFHNSGHTNSGEGPGNIGPGNQGNDTGVGKACCDGGSPGGSPGGDSGGGGGGLPPGDDGGGGGGGGGGLPPAGGGGGGTFGSNGGGFDDPWLLVRGKPGVEDGGTQAAGALGLAPGQTTCSLGENGVAISSDGQVLFARFFSEQTALEFGKDGCGEVVNYPNTEEMGG